MWRTHLRGSGLGLAVLGRSAAARVPRRDLHRDRRERRVRRERRQRRDPVGVPREPRRDEQRRVLRLDEPRRRARRRQGVRRPARRQARRARSTHRQGRVVRSRPSAGRRATRSRPRRCTTTASYTPASRAASAASAAASKRSTRADGKLVWTFYTIPGPGEVGHDTWPQDNEIWQDGGAPVWNTPAVDPELGLIYFATGNPGPDYNGSIRKGDNLFSTSVVAVDAKTGKYRWHFQQVHHDIWDYDAASPVMLFDLTIDGSLRKGIAQAEQDGLGVHPRPDERQAAGRHRRATRAAGAAPGHRRDAAVSARRRVHSAVDRHRTGRRHARERRQDLHAVLDHADVDQAGPAGRRELAAELLRSGHRVLICVRRRPDLVVPVAGGHGRATARRRRLHRRRHRRLPHERARRVRRARHAHEQARVAAAVARAVLQRVAGDGGRARVRRPQRRPSAGARLARPACRCGSSRPAQA